MSPEQQAMARRLATVVAALAMLAPFSIDTYLPSFPEIRQAFGVGDAAMQQTLSLYLLAFAGTTLVYGPLSDAFGRRRVVLAGLALYVLFSVGCAVAPDFHSLLLLRVGQGLTASAGLVVGRAVIRDAFHGAQAQQVMSRVMLTFALAPAVAPVIGGYLHAWFGWRSVFWFLALLGGLTWLLAWTRLPETLPASGRHSIHPAVVARAYGRALGHGGFMVLVFCFSTAFAGMFLYIAGAPLVVFDQLGLGAEDFGLLFLPLVSGMMTGAWLSGRLARRLLPVRTVSAGFAVMLLGAGLNLLQGLLLAPSWFTVVAPLTIYVGGMAFALPGLTVLALDYFPRNRGMASAVQGFFQTGGNALTAGVVIPLLGAAAAAMSAGQTLFCTTAFLCWVLWCRFARPPVVEHAP